MTPDLRFAVGSIFPGQSRARTKLLQMAGFDKHFLQLTASSLLINPVVLTAPSDISWRRPDRDSRLKTGVFS